MPDYTTFETRVKATERTGIRLYIIDHIHNYAFYRLLLGEPAPSKANILLSAGVHGDEPAGVEAIAFKDENPESTLIKEQLAGRRFDIFLDMHEDYDATGTYFYEGQRDEKWLAPSIAQQAKEIGTLDDDVSENDIPLAEGVLQVDPAWAERGFTSYVYEHHTDHAIITETSSNWPLPKRVEVHLLALDMILNHYSE